MSNILCLRFSAGLKPCPSGRGNRRPKAWICATGFQSALVIAALILTQGCSPKSGSKPAALFPEANEVPGWAKVGETRTFNADNLWEYIDGDAEKYRRAGVRKTLTTDYRYKEKIEAVADVYVMAATEGARQVFESESSEGSRGIELGDAARLAKGSLTFRRGPYLVRLVAYQEAPEVEDTLVALGRAIERKLGQQ